MVADGKTPGRLYLEAVLGGTTPPPPYASLLKMRLVEVGDSTTTFELPVSRDLYNPAGVVHGGAIASLADSAMGLAVVTTLAGDETFTTLELKVNFVRSVTVDSGTLRCVGRAVHRGRQTAVTEADVFDAAGQLVAKATSTCLISAIPEPAIRTELAKPAPAVAPAIAAAAPPPPPSMAPAPPLAPLPPPPIAPPPPAAGPPPSPLEHAPRLSTPSEPARPPAAPAPFSQAKMRLRLFGGEIAFVRGGQGPPVLLLHGIPSSAYLWKDVFGPLAAYYDVVAPDLLGYGDSDKRLDADLSVATQARYMVALIEALQIQRAAIVGHDIGGGIAQLMAVDEPSRVARLVLIDSVVDDSWPVAQIARLKDPAWDQIMVTLDLRKGFREGLEAGIGSPGLVTDELVEEFVRPFADPAGRRAYLRAARALNNRDLMDRSREIREISTPTLLLWGAQDSYQPLELGQRLQQKLPNAQLQVVDPGGHFLPLDRPDAVSSALLQFLSTP